MANSQTEAWWEVFLNTHGRDSVEEKAFTGFLYQHGIPHDRSVDDLDAAYAEFQAFMEASGAREGQPPPAQMPKLTSSAAPAPMRRVQTPVPSPPPPSTPPPAAAPTAPRAPRVSTSAPPKAPASMESPHGGASPAAQPVEPAEKASEET